MRHSSTVAERCLIEGVPLLGWGTHMECTFAGALSAATQATRHRVSYETILGVTGLAYRVRWYQGIESKWCPSSPCGEGPLEIEAARKALGWSLKQRGDFEGKLSAFQDEVVRSIDHGLPVLAYDEQLNMGTIVGYEDGGDTLLMHGYSDPEGPVRRNTSEITGFSILLGDRHRHMSTSDAALNGIRLGVRQWRMAHDPETDLTRGYWMGKAAYEKWAQDIANSPTFEDDQQRSLFFVSWWNFDVISDTHAYAPLYLRSVKAFFPRSMSQRLERAAELYEKSGRIFERCFLQRDAFLGPWTGMNFEDWGPQVRQRETDVLLELRNYEEQAIQVLEDLLDLIDSRDQHG